jgi:hypothetical protein
MHQELSATNLKMLQGALGNVRELVTAISSKIIAIDQEVDWEFERANPELAAAAAADRVHRKIQLEILKDNVAVISANLEALVARSMEVGLTNIDMDPIESVISETSAMLVMLTYDDAQLLPAEEVPRKASSATRHSSSVPHQDMNKAAEISEQEFPGLSPSPRSPRDGEEASDVEVTTANFDPNSMHRRPANWNEVRLKRVLFSELLAHLEGMSDGDIVATRMERVVQVRAACFLIAYL